MKKIIMLLAIMLCPILIMVGGIIGVGVDAISGANQKLLPEEVYVELVPTAELSDE